MPGTIPALFLHIQKTAGTSLVNHARQFYGASLTSHGECWGKNPEQLRNIGFISGHMGYDFARHLMPGRFTFTFLRDPAERILSMYYFCRNRDPGQFEIYRKAREMALPDFLKAALTDPCVRMHIWNNQVWQLAHGYTHLDGRTVDDFSEAKLMCLAKEHLGKFSYVGFTETFDTDAAAILRTLRLPEVTQVLRLNATPDRPKVAELSRGIKGMLDELTVLDRALYDYAWNEFSAKAGKSNRRGWWR